MDTAKNSAGSGTIQIPGFAESIRRERELRDKAFLDLEEFICGVPVKPFCLRHLRVLDQLKNGFVVPFIFERPSEKVAHALQFLWICGRHYRIPKNTMEFLFMRWRRRRFIRRTARLNSGEMFAGIQSYVSDAFFDSPSSNSKGEYVPSYASYLVHVVDSLYAAGHPLSEAQIMDMPLARVFQYLRVARKRLYPESALVNPSDKLAVDHIAKLNAEAARV
jgi:hypothetical protein